MEDRVRKRRLWRADGWRAAHRDRTQGPGIHQAGGPERLRKRISLPDVRRHAATLRSRPRTCGRTQRPADGRTVCRRRCADARDPAIRIVAYLGAAADGDDLRYTLD